MVRRGSRLESALVRRVRRTRRPLVALVALLVALVVGYVVQAASSDDTGTPTGSASVSAAATGVALSSLPPQVATTVRLIEQGGPFPYPHNDGVVFHNLEHRLPAERDGYYREYTVPTPGISTRGARRIITGETGEFWYTGNHYDTFDRVDVTK